MSGIEDNEQLGAGPIVWTRRGRMDLAYLQHVLGNGNKNATSIPRALAFRAKLELNHPELRFSQEDMMFIPFEVKKEGGFPYVGWQPIPLLKEKVGQWFIDYLKAHHRQNIPLVAAAAGVYPGGYRRRSRAG